MWTQLWWFFPEGGVAFTSKLARGLSQYTACHKLLSIFACKDVPLYGWWLLEEGTSRNVPIAGLKWYWGKIISPETKSRDLYSSRNIISNPKILGTFRDVPDNKVAICYIVWLPIALPGFGIARRNLQNSVFFSAGISFKLCAVQCVSIVLCAAVQHVSIVLCAQ